MFHPLMRVWIEILRFCVVSGDAEPFHPLMRVWIEILFLMWVHVSTLCFTLLWGCGLKCIIHLKRLNAYLFHPLMRVWIEMCSVFESFKENYCFTLLWGCGLKFALIWDISIWVIVSPSYEGVDWNSITAIFSWSSLTFHPLMRVWIEII